MPRSCDMENAQKECTKVVGKDNSSQVPFSLHAVGHMIRFLLPVAGDVERHNFYAAALDDAVYASLCLMLEHDKGLISGHYIQLEILGQDLGKEWSHTSGLQ